MIRDILFRLVSAAFAVSLGACSVGGGGSNGAEESLPPEAGSSNVHIVLGPVAGATVTVRDLTGRTVGEGTTTTFDRARDAAASGSRTRLKNIAEGRLVGRVRFSRLDLSDLDDANLVLIEGQKGTDVDADDSGLLTSSEGSSAGSISGGVSALVRVGDLRSKLVVVSPLSSLAAGAGVGSSDSFEVIERLNRLATFVLKAKANGGDLDGSGTVDFADLYAFDPSDHNFTPTTPTRVDEAAIATTALARRFLAASGDATTLTARLSAGGSGGTPVALSLEFFGDADSNDIPDVFEDPATQDVDGDATFDSTDTDLDGDGIPNVDEAALGFNPWNPDVDKNGVKDGRDDTDGDGLTNATELSPPAGRPRTDPLKADTDGDGFADKVEIDNGLNPTSAADGPTADSDGDTIPNGLEIQNGLNPTLASDAALDPDEDGLTNAAELNTHKTAVNDNDSDDDGFLDGEEVTGGFNPLDPADGGTADADSDGIPNALEVRAGLNPRSAADALLDPDEDGLTNKEELVTYGTLHNDKDSDDDTLDDKQEVQVTLTNPRDADSDDDGRTDAEEVNDPNFPSNPLKADTDGDGLSDLLEASTATDPSATRLRLFDGSPINTSPTKVDSDGDGLSDPLEMKVQDAFRPFGDVQSASNMLRGPLHPNNVAAPAQMGGLSYLNPTSTVAILEEDPDGDGKPTIEEIFHSTDPNDGSSEFLYVYEATSDGALNARRNAMDAAGFVYVPGGWDVDADGTVDEGFYVSRFEARAGTDALPAETTESTGLAGSIVYNSVTRIFSNRLCTNASGNDSDTVDIGGTCRGNRYRVDETGATEAPPDPTTIKRSIFTPALSPYVGVTWLEARLSARGSPVDAGGAAGGPYATDLPTEAQWMQMVQIAVNVPANWTGGQTKSGAMFRGHTDGNPSTPLPVGSISDRYTGTGNSASSGPEQRRTLTLNNGVRGRDFSVPLSYSIEIWDLAGNASEWTRGLFAANTATSRPSPREGGDRFANGLSEYWDYATGLNLSGSSPGGNIAIMPSWLRPSLLSGAVLGSADGAGAYYDGAPASDTDGLLGSDGGAVMDDYGYGLLPFSDGYVAVTRGGGVSNGLFAGVAYLGLSSGISRRDNATGFRLAAAAR